MKKILIALISLSVSMSIFSCKKEETYRVTASVLRLREKPDTKSKIVAGITTGTKVTIIEETAIKETINSIRAAWVKIKTADGKTGYVFSGYLEKITDGGPVVKKAGTFLIVPGKSAGPVLLGKPLSPGVFDAFGRPDTAIAPKEDMDSGVYEWKNNILVKLNNGKDKNSVNTIFINSGDFKTSEGITVGSSLDNVKKAYPGGRKSDEIPDADFGWEANGIAFHFLQNTVFRIALY